MELRPLASLNLELAGGDRLFMLGATPRGNRMIAEISAAERYRWLNSVQVVGKGAISADFSGVSYELLELA